jgi:hypothetical protein
MRCSLSPLLHSGRRGRKGVTASEVRGEDARQGGGALGWAYENPDVKLSLLWRAMQRSKDLHALLCQDITSTLNTHNPSASSNWTNSGVQSLALARSLRRSESGYDSLGAELMRYGDATMPHRITLSFQRWAWSVSQMHASLMRGHKLFAETSRTLHWVSAHVYPTHNVERLYLDPMVEVTAMMPIKLNPTGEQSPNPWMWVRDYDIDTDLGVSFENALKGRRLTKEQSLDFIRDLPYRRGALDDGGVTSLGRLTGKSSHRGVVKFEKTKAHVRKEGCPLAEDGSSTIDIAAIPTVEGMVTSHGGRIPLGQALDTSEVEDGALISFLAHSNFDLLAACCEGHARILSSLFVEGRPVVVMSNNAAVVRYLDTVFGEFVEKGAVEIVGLPEEATQLDEVLGAVLQDDPTFTPKGGFGAPLQVGEATQYFAQRHRGTWIMTDGEAQASKWGVREVRDVVQYALQNGADTLCVGEYMGTAARALLQEAIPPNGRLQLLTVPNTPHGDALHQFVASSVSTSNLTIIGGCGSVGTRTVESMSRGRVARDIALSPNHNIQAVGVNIAATDALLYLPAASYRLGQIGNTKRYLKATRSVLQHAMCPNAAVSSDGPWGSVLGAGVARRVIHRALSTPDYSSGGIFGGQRDDTALPSVGPRMSPSRTLASTRELNFISGLREGFGGKGGLALLAAKVFGV